MKPKSQKQKWAVNASLFMLFIASFFLDLTGLELHQWLGMIVGAGAAYHLITHWTWVKAVSRRFFGSTSVQARGFYLLDAAMLVGLATIILTGVVISSWLNLSLAAYDAWHSVHVIASIVTISTLMLKVIVHWRMIANLFKRPATQLVMGRPTQPVPSAVPMQSVGARVMSRRDFLKVMGVAGVLSVVALGKAVQSLQSGALNALTSVEAASVPTAAATSVPSTATPAAVAAAATAVAVPSVPTSVPTSLPTALPTATAVPQVAVSTCSVRCPRGCSFPGHCRRYADSNGNGRCDLGECL